MFESVRETIGWTNANQNQPAATKTWGEAAFKATGMLGSGAALGYLSWAPSGYVAKTVVEIAAAQLLAPVAGAYAGYRAAQYTYSAVDPKSCALRRIALTAAAGVGTAALTTTALYYTAPAVLGALAKPIGQLAGGSAGVVVGMAISEKTIDDIQANPVRVSPLKPINPTAV